MKINKKNLLILFSSCFLVSIIFLNKTKAIPIGPDKYFFEVQNGQTYEKELNIYGKKDIDKKQKLYINAVGMIKTGEENTREFYFPDPNDSSQTANWISVGIKEISISPGETIVIPWKITIPEKLPECGTKLAALMVSNNPKDFQNLKDTSVDVSKEIISQIHIDLPQIKDKECKVLLNKLEFYVNRKKFLGIAKIFNYDKVPFVTRIENKGKKIARKPKGFIEIFGFGDKITIPFNNENSAPNLDIYPETTRRFDNIWIDEDYPINGNFFQKLGYELTHLKFGKYKARLGITKNTNTQITAYDTFWIIPWRILLIILIPILIILILLYIIIKKHNKEKKYNK